MHYRSWLVDHAKSWVLKDQLRVQLANEQHEALVCIKDHGF